MRENCTYSLSGGRWPACKRATSDPTQIFNGRENHVFATILAVPAQRLAPTGHTQFTFWETPAGTAKAMRDWFYPGDLFGQEFTYPAHPYQLTAMVTPPPAPQEAAPPAAPPAAPETQESTTTENTENNTAEAAPPPPPPEPAPEQAAPPEPTPVPAPEAAPAPTQLPQTASPYPTIGALGLALLAFGGLLRLRLFQR